jgi:hypothetical protein
MKPCLLLLTSITFGLLIILPACSSTDPLTHPCKSARQAMKKGTFAGTLQVSPAEFHWEGHLFKVHECWLEAPRRGLVPKKVRHDFHGVCFTLEVDGKYPSRAAGSSMFRPSDGVYWYGALPVHCICFPLFQISEGLNIGNQHLTFSLAR